MTTSPTRSHLLPVTLAVLLLMTSSAAARTKVQEEISGFDGSKTLYVAPHVTGMVRLESIEVSASWNSATPDVIGIGVTIENVVVPQAISFNADGAIVYTTKSLNSPSIQTSPFYGIGVARTFAMSRMDFKRIVAAKRLWVRVMTSQGALDYPIMDKKPYPAHLALEMLSEQVSKESRP